MGSDFIYVSNVRCASRSIRLTLFPENPTSKEHPCWWMVPAREIKQRFEREGRDWEHTFKFSFVRNPWDRLVSAHRFWQPDSRLRHRLEHPDWDESDPLAFRDWLHQMVESGVAERSPLFQQWPMVTDDDGVLLVDFVGRFERLREDWLRVGERIGMTRPLPRTHTTTHRHYSSYFDDRTADLISAACARDIELFDYELERLRRGERLKDELDYRGHDAARRALERVKSRARTGAPRIYGLVRKLARR